MRMMKNNNNETVMVIGIDHGYGNMKTATRCFPSGVARYDKEPIFQNNLSIFSYLEESVQNFSLNQLKNILLSVGLLDIHIVR